MIACTPKNAWVHASVTSILKIVYAHTLAPVQRSEGRYQMMGDSSLGVSNSQVIVLIEKQIMTIENHGKYHTTKVKLCFIAKHFTVF